MNFLTAKTSKNEYKPTIKRHSKSFEEQMTKTPDNAKSVEDVTISNL